MTAGKRQFKTTQILTMSTFKRILTYFAWAIISLLSVFVYMRIILGAKPEESESFFKIIFRLFYEYAFIYIGLIIGSVVAFLFILIDVFYLNKRLKNNMKATVFRFFIVILITILVGIIHYVLEKVINVI
jgi:hypothetical protein